MRFVTSKIYTIFQGTELKSAPEVFKQGLFYPDKSTVWTLGILLYNMVFGINCFSNEEEICKKQFTVERRISKGIQLN